MKSSQHFREQLGVMSAWFEGWNACEQTVALCSLLQRLAPPHARFLAVVLQQHSSTPHLQPLEDEANDPNWVNHLSNESKEVAVSGLLSHLPLLRPGNLEAKIQYLALIPKILAHSIRHGVHIEESRQLLSYSLIHPAVSCEDRLALTGWLRQLEDRIHNTNGFIHEKLPECNNAGLDLCRPGMGHSLPSGIGSHHMYAANHSLSAHPDGTQTLPLINHQTMSQFHAPLSPQSSATSSGSESQFSHEATSTAMRDVPSWLKGLRLHKYSYIFKNMSYDEMMEISEEKLEKMNITKGARHKIVLSIQKLRERQLSLQSVEKDLEDGEGSVRVALSEIRSVLSTPLQRYNITADPESDDSNPPSPPDPHLNVLEGDVPGQITRLLGKICSTLLIASNQEENMNFFVMIIDKCLSHEAFSPIQKRRLFSWKQQVQKANHPLPPRRTLHRATSSNSTGNPKWEQQVTVQQDRRRLAVQPQRPRFVPSSSVIKRPSLQDHNSKPHIQIQRTNSAPVRPQPSPIIYDGTDSNEINIRLESLCLSVTEHALGSFDGAMPLF